MSQCTIHLENYPGVYYVGSEIRGWLDCYFAEEITVRAIKIRFKCNETNKFTNVQSYTNPISHRHTITSDDLLVEDGTKATKIMYNEQILLGSDSSRRILDRGTHIYPFSYTLPLDIPSTFNGRHGCVFYKLQGIVDIPKSFDYKDECIVAVMSPIDFNKIPKNLQKGRTYSDETTICCFCCKTGVVTMDVTLPKRAFVPGEVMDLKVTVSNMSNSNIDGLMVILTKIVTLLSCMWQEDTIVSLREHGVGAHNEHTFELELAIPESTLIPNFINCRLFQVRYKLQVSCEILACPMNLNVCIRDILMGHVQCDGGVEDEGNGERNGSPNLMTNLLRNPFFLQDPPSYGTICPCPNRGGDDSPPPSYLSCTSIGPDAPSCSGASGPIDRCHNSRES